MQHPADLYPRVGVRVLASLRCHEYTSRLLTLLAQFRCVVVGVAQDVAHLGGHIPEQVESYYRVG